MTEPAPVPMLLWCPECRARHVDVGAFATKPHHTHACQGCGMVWRPALVPTVGVRFLPGFKDEPNEVAPRGRPPEIHDALLLTQRDVEIVTALSGSTPLYATVMRCAEEFGWLERREDGAFQDNSARAECEAKLARLGMHAPWKVRGVDAS